MLKRNYWAKELEMFLRSFSSVCLPLIQAPGIRIFTEIMLCLRYTNPITALKFIQFVPRQWPSLLQPLPSSSKAFLSWCHMPQHNTASFLWLKCAECDILYCVAQWSNCVLSLEGTYELEEETFQHRMYSFQPHKTIQLWVREARGDINEQLDF